MSLPIERPVELSWGQQYRPSLAEGPVSVYELKTQPDTESTENLVFSLRAPGNRLLLSAKDCFIEQQFDVTMTGSWTLSTIGAPNVRPIAGAANAVGAVSIQSGQKCAFGSGNCGYNDAITSMNFIINNQSVSQNNQDAYMRCKSTCN